MQTLTIDGTALRAPTWLWAASALGVLWNAHGLHQFVSTFTPAGQAAMTAGMTAAQAEVYLGLPAWISVAFAAGVLGGLIGSIGLAMRRRLAQPVLAASLVGYVLLFAGDAYHGVFAAVSSQLAILAVVVLIAAGLLCASRNRHPARPAALKALDDVTLHERMETRQYMLLLNEPETEFAKRNDPEQAGIIVKGDGLQGPHTATTVRIRDGRRVVQDGPFADAKEQLGGYFVIEVPDLDTALEWAARAPSATSASVEVRPVLPPMTLPGAPAAA